jgi:hypothetical protein
MHSTDWVLEPESWRQVRAGLRNSHAGDPRGGESEVIQSLTAAGVGA